jgi:hypothetical protein
VNLQSSISNLQWKEAASGFAPERNGFADRRLTAWLSRHPGKDKGRSGNDEVGARKGLLRRPCFAAEKAGDGI